MVTLLSVGNVYGTMVRKFGISPVRDSIASILHNASPETHYTEDFLHNMVQQLGRKNSAESLVRWKRLNKPCRV